MIMQKFFKPNWGIILRFTGWLLAVDAVFMSIAIFIGLLHDGHLSYQFMITAVITGVSGVIVSKKVKPVSDKILLRDALFLTAFLWVVFSAVGAIPFLSGDTGLGFVDAFFESVSGYTSTGATVITDVEACDASILLWRAMIQWIGGIGIIMFSLAVIPLLNNREGIQLFNAEVSGITSEKLRPRISGTAMTIGVVYLGMTVIEFLLLWAGPMGAFDSVCHTLSTVSTGGFSTRNAGISAWNSSYVELVVIIFMFLGGTNFQLLYISLTRAPMRILKNDTFRSYLAIVILVTVFISFTRLISGTCDDAGEYVTEPLFMVVSAISSTGFANADYEGWGTVVIIFIMIIMFFGACAGSTTSGAKIDRLIFLGKSTKNIFYKIIHPNHVLVVRVNEKVISESTVNKVIGFLSVYVLIVVLCCMVVAAFGHSIEDSLFVSISCMSNIGLGYGTTGVHGSFASLDTIPKIVLTLEMLVGRLEIFTFLVIFTPYFWRK